MGIPQFQQISQTILDASAQNVSQAMTSIAAGGGSKQITFYAAAGTIGRAVGMSAAVPVVPAAAGANSHQLQLTAGPASSGVTVLFGKALDNQLMQFMGGTWVGTFQQVMPAVGAPVSFAGTFFDSTDGVSWQYTNNSTHEQTGTLNFWLSFLQEVLAQ